MRVHSLLPSLSPPRQLVRKKAVMAMHRFLLLSPDSISHLEDDFRRSLSDQDPGVMEAALILFHDLIKVSFGQGLVRFPLVFLAMGSNLLLKDTPECLSHRDISSCSIGVHIFKHIINLLQRVPK